MAPSLVQSASNTATSGTSVTVTLGSNTTAGNCLVVCVGTAQQVSNPTVSGITLGGSAGNFASAKGQNASGVDGEIWVDPNCAGGQTSVVVSFNAGSGSFQGNCVVVMEWSGIATASPVDKTNVQSAASQSSWSSLSSGTLTQASELVVGMVGQFSGSSDTITGPSSPWTNLAQINAGTSAGLLAGYQVVSATTAQTYSGTFTGTDSYTAVIVTLLAAAPASGSVQSRATVPVPRRRLARAIIQHITGLPPPAKPNRQPPPGPRPRPPRRAVIQHVTGTIPVFGRAPREPFQPSRARRPQRAVVRSITGTAPAITAVYRPQLRQPVPRRPSRAVVLSVRPPPAAAAAGIPSGFQDRRPGYLKKRVLFGV